MHTTISIGLLTADPELSDCLVGSGRPAIAALMMDTMVVLTNDVTVRSIDSSSPGQCHEHSWELFSPTLIPAMSGSIEVMVKLNDSTGKLVQESQHTIISDSLWPNGSSSASSVSTHHQKEQNKHQGYEIHTNVDKFHLLGRAVVNHILPSAKSNLH